MPSAWVPPWCGAARSPYRRRERVCNPGNEFPIAWSNHRAASSASEHLSGGDVHVVAARPERLHLGEAAVEHVAVELDAVAVGIVEVHAARDVVRDGRLHLDAHRLQLVMRGLQLREA